jgi:serine phosphatase RsbU (regulator of sigma subunit)
MHECGDVVRVVNRPDGGICAIVADGQGHGRSARSIATMAVGRITALVSEGARADAALVAANDLLLAHRGGQISCEASVIAVDPVDGVVRVTRFARGAAAFTGGEGRARFGGEAPPLGVYRGALPVVDVVDVALPVACLVATDGVHGAGGRVGRPLMLDAILERHASAGGDVAAHSVLAEAIHADDGRPRDDMSVVCLTFAPSTRLQTIRCISAQWPLD